MTICACCVSTHSRRVPALVEVFMSGSTTNAITHAFIDISFWLPLCEDCAVYYLFSGLSNDARDIVTKRAWKAEPDCKYIFFNNHNLLESLGLLLEDYLWR